MTDRDENDKQLLIGMYDVFDPNPANPNSPIGMVAVFQRTGAPSAFDTQEHWAFTNVYRGPGINETLKVKRASLGSPSQSDWDRFLTFLRANASNIYIVADCSHRAHPPNNTLPRP